MWDLVRILVSSQEYRSNAFSGAHLSFKKCFYEVYLAHRLPRDERVACFLHSHRALADRLRFDVLNTIYFEEAEIWQLSQAEHHLSVTLQASRTNLSEGELCLSFKRYGSYLYTISFTIVPGRILHKTCHSVVLVSRMQGTRGEHDNIRAVSKIVHEVNPQAFLFSVLCGIGRALDAPFLACVEARNQIYFQEEREDLFRRTYDDFILAQGRTSRHEDGYLVLDLPVQPKPLNLVSSIHRLRTKKKRLFRESLVQEAESVVKTWSR